MGWFCAPKKVLRREQIIGIKRSMGPSFMKFDRYFMKNLHKILKIIGIIISLETFQDFMKNCLMITSFTSNDMFIARKMVSCL